MSAVVRLARSDRDIRRDTRRERVLVWVLPVVFTVLLPPAILFQSSFVFEPAWAITTLNFVFVTLVPLAAAFIAAFAYRRTGVTAILALGGAMLVLALGAGLPPAVLVAAGEVNAALTLHNSSVMVATGYQLAAVVASVVGISLGRRRRLHVAVLYGLAAATILGLLGLTLLGFTPPFWTDAGTTFLRQVVLGVAITFALLTAVMWWEIWMRDPSIRFLAWYVPGLLLVTLGLAGIYLEPEVGGPVSWLGRGCQYVSSLYILIALLVATGEGERPLGIALLQAHLPLRPLVESTTQAVMAIGGNGSVVYWNDAARRLFGHAAIDAFDREPVPLMTGAGTPEESVAQLGSLLVPAKSAGGHALLKLRKANGSDFDAELTVFASPEDSSLLVCVVSDVTERIRSREELDRRVRQRTAELQALNAELARANAVKDEFLGLVSHEMKTPVTSILAAGSMIRRRFGNEDEDGLIVDLQAESNRLAGIIDNLLALARLDSGAAFGAEPLLVGHLIDAAVKQLERQYPGRRVRVKAERGAVVEGNAEQVSMVIRNFVSNALKYSPAGTEVEVVLSQSGGMALVEVMDRGLGLAPEELDHIFQPFYRGSAGVHIAGIGIGLTVCRRIVESMGGEVGARIRDGGGSIFSFSMPLAPAEPEEHLVEAQPPVRA